jgi:hypothetical protein
MPKKTFKKDWSGINQKIKDRKNKFKDDDRLYKLSYVNNQAKVTMRLLDSIDTDLPYVEVKSHFFNDVGGWLIEPCPKTYGKECPICEDLSKTYKTDKELYESIKERKNSLSYYTNVLIIEDKNNPDNVGKVFIFKFGAKIMEKIEDIIAEDKQPWDDNCGVNFIFSAKKKGGNMPNYDASRFSDEETSLEDYGVEKTILASRHKLGTLVDESKCKSYSELKEKYEKVIGEADDKPSKSKPKTKRNADEDDDIEDEDIVEDDISDDIGDEDMLSESDDDDFFDDLDDDE